MKKLVIALMQHETNTFSPIKTSLASFGGALERKEPFKGDAAIREFEGTGTPIGAYIDLAKNAGIEFEIPVAAKAEPSGPADSATFETMVNAICDSVARGCDGIMLDLHGAMVTDDYDDGEGELLRRIRKIAPEVPIAVALDFHTNLSKTMVENSTIIVGYKTYPHTDMYETGEIAGRLLLRTLNREISPVMVWDSRPMLTHMLRQASAEQPMTDIFAMATQAERSGSVLSATVFGGFPLADVPHVSFSSVVIADKDEAPAREVCDRILNEAWKRRNEFVYELRSIEDSISEAAQLTEYPVLLIDHGDNCGAGGTQDDMSVVKEVIEQGLTDVAVGSICDPAAVREMIRAGVGSEITIELGGKSNSPAISYHSQSVTVTGIVRAITNGEFKISGPMHTGVKIFMGRTVVLDTGPIEYIVSELRHEPRDLGLFTSVGIDPVSKKYLLLKSRLHYRASFDKVGRHIVECAGKGVTTSDYASLPFRRIKRPIYPLDKM